MRWTEFRGRGFFCRDGLLEIWLALVVDELDRACDGGLELGALRDDFRAQAMVAFDGLMETRLDAHLAGERERRSLVAVCQRLRARLVQGERPSGPCADRVGGERWSRQDTLAGLARVAGAFLWLLDPDA